MSERHACVQLTLATANHDSPDAYKTWSRNFEIAKSKPPPSNDGALQKLSGQEETVEAKVEDEHDEKHTTPPPPSGAAVSERKTLQSKRDELTPLQLYRQYNAHRGEKDTSGRAHQDSYYFVTVGSAARLDEVKQRLRTLQQTESR